MKYLFLHEMVMPKVLTFVYWFVSIIVILSALSMMFTGSFINGLLLLVLGLVIVRIQFELIYVFFGIYEQVKKIADKQ